MIAEQLIHYNIPPLLDSDLYSKALSLMQQFHIQYLPVLDSLNNKQYIGMLDEYAISDSTYFKGTISESNIVLPRFFVYSDVHLYEVIKYMQANQLSAVAVLNRNEEYRGLITLSAVLSYMATASSVQEIGGIIVLEMGEHDYVLSEIARIAEDNDTKILSLFVIPRPNSRIIDVTIKLNRSDLDNLIAALERHGYEINATYQNNEYTEDIADHFSSLINYLNI
jgi:acetoin utilization protein AcuB